MPKEFRFDADAVRIRREGDAVILEPLEDEWASFPRLSDDIAENLLAAVQEEMPQQERPDLDAFFK